MQSEQVHAEAKEKDPDVLEFRLVRKTRKVKIYTSEDSDDCRDMTIREMTGADRDDWQNETIKRNKIDPQTSMRIGYDVKDLQAYLIAKCLFNESGERVEVKEIRNWPASVQDGLFTECQKINALTPEAFDQAKKT